MHVRVSVDLGMHGAAQLLTLLVQQSFGCQENSIG